MPTAPPIACRCGGKRTNGVCDRCGPRKRSDWRSSDLYRTKRWQDRRLCQLMAEPTCVECAKQGLVRVATVADHVTPWDGNEDEFWHGALQSMCASCHGIKSASERK